MRSPFSTAGTYKIPEFDLTLLTGGETRPDRLSQSGVSGLVAGCMRMASRLLI